MLIKPISKTAIIYKNVLNLNSELAPRSVKFFFSAAGGGAESKQNSIMCDPLFEQTEISRQAALIVFNSLCLGLLTDGSKIVPKCDSLLILLK